MTIMDGGPLRRDKEWQTLDGMLFTILAMTSLNKKKNAQARVKLVAIFTIKLFS